MEAKKKRRIKMERKWKKTLKKIKKAMAKRRRHNLRLDYIKALKEIKLI